MKFHLGTKVVGGTKYDNKCSVIVEDNKVNIIKNNLLLILNNLNSYYINF
jgi:hypothetical protein